MRKQGAFQPGDRPSPGPSDDHYAAMLTQLNVSRKLIAGVILLVALLAFELFNFDTTRYALRNLLGDVQFAGLGWATILAIAFCAIDFAGLTRLFTPERGRKEPTAVWYLMGAWLIGATMNAVMTWWAVSLTLLAHDFGNEVLSREQLLRWVPFFVATLVWLTRILFIGAFSVAGEYIFDLDQIRHPMSSAKEAPVQTRPSSAPLSPSSRPAPARPAYAARPKQVQKPQSRPSSTSSSSAKTRRKSATSTRPPRR